MMKLILIDGHSILNRAFYGVPDLTNSEGLHTNAVYGFLNIMFKFLEEENPTNIAIAFDRKEPTFRHKMFKEYKGTRKKMPDELTMQVPVIKELLQKMGIQTVELPGYEADDILGTLAKKAENEGYEVRIITGDRDLLQLATEHIMIRIPKTKKGGTEVENYLANDVLLKYQVTPDEFIDVKALMGDTADNIPGVPSVGEKTATSLIKEYGSVEKIYENLDKITKKKLHESLTENKDLAFLSKDLARININSPVELDFSNTLIEDMYTTEALEMVKKLEFKSIIKKFSDKLSTLDTEINIKPVIVEDYDEAVKILDKAAKSDNIGIGVFGKADNVSFEFAAISVAFSEHEIFVIKKQWFITDDLLSEKLSAVLLSDKTSVYLTNLKNILKYVKMDVLYYPSVYDLSIAAYLVNPLKDTYYYDNLARDYLSVTLYNRQELLGKNDDFTGIEANEDNFINYCSYTALIPLMAKDNIFDRLKELQEFDLYNNIEMPLIYALDRMEKYGVIAEKEELKKYGDELSSKISVLESEIYNEVGKEFNINSPKQLGEILFTDMGIKGGKKTKTGYSTSAEVLENLAPEYPFVGKILEYRQLSKLKSTYADGLINYICDDGRIHGTFNQTITATGRISSTEPNLQNIPIRMEIGKAFRKVFVPEKGYKFIDADYSQIELRLLAHLSGDNNLIDAYKTKKDIHRITASKVFGTPLEEVSELQRRNAKAVNFGIVYGISAFGLAKDLMISRKQASEYIESYFETYKDIKKFLDETVENAKKDGYVTTLFGRRRPIPELSSSNFMQRSFGERIAMNSPIQGTAADIMKLAMINVDRELFNRNLKSHIVLQIHDELLIECHEDEIKEVEEILEKEMKNVIPLKVELEIGMGMGYNWLEAH